MKFHLLFASILLTASLPAETATENKAMIVSNHGRFTTYEINPALNKPFLDFVAEEAVARRYRKMLVVADIDDATITKALDILIEGHTKMQTLFLESSWQRAVNKTGQPSASEIIGARYREMQEQLKTLLGQEKHTLLSRIECTEALKSYASGLLEKYEPALSESQDAMVIKLFQTHLTDKGLNAVPNQDDAEIEIVAAARSGVSNELADFLKARFEQRRFGFGITIPIVFAPGKVTKINKANLLK